MKISELMNKRIPTLSFEVFPPKTTDGYDSVEKATEEIASLKPDFMSVTYGAGGSTGDFTVSIASNIQNNLGVNTLAHLTCVKADKTSIFHTLDVLKEHNIKNILALRGDIPEGFDRESMDYRYASEMIKDIKAYGDFCIGGACYPEGHPESSNMEEDIENLKKKVEAGCEFLTTQMFFDNNILYNYLYKIRERGITVPIVAGIMPVTNAKQIVRSCKLSGTYLPQRFKAIVDRFGENPKAMKEAGIAYATDQIIDLLANGVNNIHVYSMNKPEVAAAIYENLKVIMSYQR